MSGLAGARVLVPRAGAWGDHVARELAARGADAVIAPLISTMDPIDVVARDRDLADLADGRFDWVFVTSATSVEVLSHIDLPPATQVAVVGPATARAARARSLRVGFEPDGPASANNMIQQWLRRHPGPARCLVVRSDLATAVVSDELELRGHDVRVCIAYRTVGVDLPDHIVADLRSGAIDTVLLTSLSVARELRRQVGALPLTTRVASIGAGTTHDAEALGYVISRTASRQSIDALIADLDTDPRPTTMSDHRIEETR